MFKSRCDLRLADVSEQADVEKKEMEELARKYDDKYKAAQLSAGKLAAEERALQQMQEKAHIIMNATSRLDRGGDPNQLLQVRCGAVQCGVVWCGVVWCKGLMSVVGAVQ
ncbi:unnamed protein product [Closterium sp. NIES-54]